MNYHIPVLLKGSVDLLISGKEGFYVDATAGGGGHSIEILKRITPSGKLIAFDRDLEAEAELTNKLLSKGLEDYCIIIRDNFSNLKKHLASMNISKISGILFDLGVSSRQIDAPERGFSYMKDGPLDMRMDKENGRTAESIVNNASEKELEDIIRNYGEERMVKRIVRNIIAHRPVKTTLALSDAIKAAVPGNNAMPACVRVFQALRIAVNDELGSLETSVNDAISLLEKNCRIVVISYHSLEDRIVKQIFKRESTDCLCDARVPKCSCNHKKTLRIITKKPVMATEAEIEVNIRSRSAKLRAAERI